MRSTIANLIEVLTDEDVNELFEHWLRNSTRPGDLSYYGKPRDWQRQNNDKAAPQRSRHQTSNPLRS